MIKVLSHLIPSLLQEIKRHKTDSTTLLKKNDFVCENILYKKLQPKEKAINLWDTKKNHCIYLTNTEALDRHAL